MKIRSGGVPRALALPLALCLVSVVLAACGSGSPSASSSASPTNAPSGFDLTAVKANPALHAMLPSAILAAGRIRVATNMPYAPWESYAHIGSNQATGIDYDLSQALAARLGVSGAFDQTDFNAIIPSLLAGKADTAMAGMFDTPVRRKVLDFVDYASDGTCIMVAKGNPLNIQSFADLAGKTVAVQSGTVEVNNCASLNAQFKAAGKPAIKVLQLPQMSDVELAISSGKAVACINTTSVAAYEVKTSVNSAGFEIVNSPAIQTTFPRELLGIGVPKSDSQLATSIQKALQSLIADGTYAKILQKYGEMPVAVQSAQMNQGK